MAEVKVTDTMRKLRASRNRKKPKTERQAESQVDNTRCNMSAKEKVDFAYGGGRRAAIDKAVKESGG